MSDSPERVSRQFVEVLGREGIGSEKDRQAFSVDNHQPQWVLFPRTVEQVAEIMHVVSAHNLATTPAGGGTYLHLGAPPRRCDVVLSLRCLKHMLDYQPADMTVTVEGGMVLQQVQDVLGRHGQWLSLDPPLPQHTTIGGMIAGNLNGPLRLSQGTVRDLLIGIKVVSADGKLVKGGGRVVKNVAGYDLPKLHCGSLGTLGVIVEATFKVRPRPQREKLVCCLFPSAHTAMAFVLEIMDSELQPLALELVSPTLIAEEAKEYGVLVWLGGEAEEIDYQGRRLLEMGPRRQGTQLANGDPIQRLLTVARDFPITRNGTVCCKASLLPTQVAEFVAEGEEEAGLHGVIPQFLAHAGSGIVYCRWTISSGTISFVEWLRAKARKLQGYLVVERIDSSLKEKIDVWGSVGESFPLMKKLKEKLDPQGILNPGRFVGGI